MASLSFCLPDIISVTSIDSSPRLGLMGDDRQFVEFSSPWSFVRSLQNSTKPISLQRVHLFTCESIDRLVLVISFLGTTVGIVVARIVCVLLRLWVKSRSIWALLEVGIN